jgi:microcompartment protein CcmK/EutM
MKPGKVIGTVSLGVRDPALRGGRWVVIAPMGADELTGENSSDVSRASSLVAYDNLGAGMGDAVLYVEGAEAMQPFDRPIPLDAITVALIDIYSYTPPASEV